MLQKITLLLSMVFFSLFFFARSFAEASAKHDGKFGTAINCIDGRVQSPVAEWMKQKFSLTYVDTVTEPGADKFVATAPKNSLDALKANVLISINAHHSKTIAVVGHAFCAANPVDKKTHWKEIQEAVIVIESWKLPVRVVGLWVNENWNVEEVVSGAPR